jgi:hypothetical protein
VPPRSPRLILETGLEYQEMAGMCQVPVAGTPSTYAFSPDGLSLAVYEYHGASVHALAVLDTKIPGSPDEA